METGSSMHSSVEVSNSELSAWIFTFAAVSGNMVTMSSSTHSSVPEFTPALMLASVAVSEDAESYGSVLASKLRLSGSTKISGWSGMGQFCFI